MNRVYKLTPVSMYDIRGLESWLEKLAVRGLFLKKYRPLVCTFTKGEPKQVRYRLEPCHTVSGDVPPDMLELFQACGWEYVGDINLEMLLFCSADPRAPEPHTDPDIQLEQWNKLVQKARKDLRANLLIDLFVILGVTIYFLWGGTPLVKLMGIDFSTLYWPIFLLTNSIPQTLACLARYRELSAVARELEGTRPRHRLWFPSRQFFSWATVLWLAFLLCLLPIAHYRDTHESPLTEFTPLVITDPESGVTVGRASAFDHDVNRLGFSPLCPHQRRLWDFQTTAAGFLSLETYWLDFPDWLSFLAVPTARDLLDDSLKLDGPYYFWLDKTPQSWTIREHTGTGADWLSVADSENGVYHAVAAALGDKAVLVRYTGHGDLAEYLDEIVKMVQ